MKSESVSSTDAERYLQAALGEPDGYWRVFLQNNRRPDRSPPHHIPFVVMRGRPQYQTKDLDAFIEYQRESELNRGKVPGGLDDALRAIGGWPTGRPFSANITPQVEEGTGVTFISIFLANPLIAFRLDPDQARSVAAELIEAANVVDRATGGEA